MREKNNEPMIATLNQKSKVKIRLLKGGNHGSKESGKKSGQKGCEEG